MCAMQTRVLILSLLGSSRVDSSIHNKGFPAILENNWQAGVPNSAIYTPKLAESLLHFFRVGLACCTISIYYSIISAFFEPHHYHKT